LGPVQGGLVAIKSVPILPSGSPKLTDLKKELEIMRNVKHANILTMDGLYVDLTEDSLWIKMELMERSLADVVALVEEGVTIPEKVIARFASDVSCFIVLIAWYSHTQILGALIYLQNLGIAHRDLRSDNLLLNKDGLLKLGLSPQILRILSLIKPTQPTSLTPSRLHHNRQLVLVSLV
jgi:serine/threonine protein kinase